MKRFLLFILVMNLFFSSWALPKSSFKSQSLHFIYEEYIPENLPEITFEELKGQSYIILEETADYIIVEVNGDIYVVYK